MFSNSLISDKSYSKQKILKNFFNNKTLFLILFIIFSFGWNPKTVITGDIASFLGYRIPVKIINYFSSENIMYYAKYIRSHFKLIVIKL